MSEITQKSTVLIFDGRGNAKLAQTALSFEELVLRAHESSKTMKKENRG